MYVALCDTPSSSPVLINVPYDSQIFLLKSELIWRRSPKKFQMSESFRNRGTAINFSLMCRYTYEILLCSTVLWFEHICQFSGQSP